MTLKIKKIDNMKRKPVAIKLYFVLYAKFPNSNHYSTVYQVDLNQNTEISEFVTKVLKSQQKQVR